MDNFTLLQGKTITDVTEFMNVSTRNSDEHGKVATAILDTMMSTDIRTANELVHCGGGCYVLHCNPLALTKDCIKLLYAVSESSDHVEFNYDVKFSMDADRLTFMFYVA